MPIKGLSTREDAAPRFKVLGKLRKGTKKIDGRMGKDLPDYFRFTSDDPDVETAFYAIYSDGKPNHIACYLPFDTMEENFSSWRESYGQNGLVKCRCDGDYWINWIEGERYMRGRKLCEMECKSVPNRCPDCPLKAVGRLTIIVPDVWRAGYIGLITVETHGWNDIGFLSGKLVQHEPLAGKEFTLYRETKKVGAPNKKTHKRMAVKKSLVFIELSQRWLLKELDAAENNALARLEPGRQAIPATVDTDIDFSAVAGLEKPDEPIYVDTDTDEPETSEAMEGVVVEPEDQEPGAETEQGPPPPMPPYPDDTHIEDSTFFGAVATRMDFETVGAVMNALHSILGPREAFKEDDREGYWNELWKYKHAETTE